MDNNYFIEHYDKAPTVLENLLFDGINAEAFKAKKLSAIETFAFSIKDKSGHILGGITGITYYSCLYIDMLFVEKEYRKEGLGAHLMTSAETLGKKRNCKFSTVNTMDWEALPFYQKLGYSIEFTRDGYEKNSKLFLLRKSLE